MAELTEIVVGLVLDQLFKMIEAIVPREAFVVISLWVAAQIV